MSVGQKLAMLKIRSTFLSLRNLEAAPEDTMQLKRLIKRSNESLGPYLFGKLEFWNGPHWARAGNFVKKPPLIVNVTYLELNGFNASNWVS